MKVKMPHSDIPFMIALAPKKKCLVSSGANMPAVEVIADRAIREKLQYSLLKFIFFWLEG